MIDFGQWQASKNKHKKKLQSLNSLRLKIAKINVNVTKHNKKQPRISHFPHY